MQQYLKFSMEALSAEVREQVAEFNEDKDTEEFREAMRSLLPKFAAQVFFDFKEINIELMKHAMEVSKKEK